MSPRKGRPPSDNPKSERLYIRATPDEKREIQAFSQQYGLSVMDLIRQGMVKVEAAKKARGKAEKKAEQKHKKE